LGPANDNHRPFLSGIILAAGTSTRMGRAKQLLSLENRPLLQHVVDATAASCLDEIILVLGHRAEEIRGAIHCPTRVRVEVNANYAEGQSTSLRAGLRAASPCAEAAAVLLGDQPRVTAQLIDRVATAFADSAACVVRPVYSGIGAHSVPGHPVFLARRIWPDIDKLRSDQGARALLVAHPEWLLEVSVDGDVPHDVDTWEDYRYSVGGEPTSTLHATDNLRGRT
jgi:molybdenum cofactor cytidylyltransferase